MQVYLHAVEVEGGGGVRYLATGVWRPQSLEKDPLPVDRQRISPEKMEVGRGWDFYQNHLFHTGVQKGDLYVL